ncbi:MAG TPA: DUF4175 family protein [Planctomycetota bacterium]|nr:DUF4175 family protein [Planctomycetota bacterium]
MKVAALGAAGVIPQAIVEKLTRLIRRVRWLIVLRGVCAIAATAIGSLLAVMAIDASVTLFSLTTRWALTLSAYGLTALAAAWFLVRPLAHSFTLTGTARAIEAHHPELQERISSAVELLTSKDAPELRGSDELIRALVVQAADSARGLQPRREVTLRAARPYLVVAALVAAIFATVFVLWPDKARFLLTRATAPFINLPNLRARDLVVSPGDCVILEGYPLHVEVEVPRRSARQAFLRWAEPGGEEVASEMALLYSGGDASPRFAVTCPPATASFRYRVHAGDALSSFYAATVVPKPAVEQLDVRYEFPRYTRKEPVTQAKAEGDIKALPGTRVTLTARTNKPMASAQMLINGAVPSDAKGEPLVTTELVRTGEQPAVVCRMTLGAELAGKWTLKLVDEHKFESSTAEHSIEVAPDTPPTVAVIQPVAKQLRLPPNAPLPIAYTIEDDIGLASAELLIEVDGRGRPSKSLALPKEAKKLTRAVAGETALQLGAMDLRNAKYVTFQLRATDNCPKEFKGPHHGLSDLYRIELDVKAPSFAVAQLMDQEKKLKETLEKVKRDLKAAKKESEHLKESLPQHPQPREKDQKRIDDMRKDLASADSTARKVAQEMEGGYFDKLGEKVKELADEHIAKAENLAGQTKLAEEAERRGMLARETDRLIDRSIKMVEELMKQVEPVSDVVRQAIEMNEMAQREAELAKERLAQEAADAAKAAEANMTPEEWRKAQEALAKEMAEMLKDTPGGVEAALKADQAAAAEMAKEARAMAQEQQALAKENDQLAKIQQVDKALGELAKQQQALAQDAAAGAASQPQAQPMGEAAKDIQAGALGEAVKNQAAAEAALNQAAQQMAQGQQPGAEAGAPKGGEAGQQAAPKGGEPGQQGAPQNAQQVADLAKRQGELREQTQALAEQRQQLAGEHAQGQMERLRAEQGEVAREAGELAQNVDNVAPQADGVQNKAAEAAGEAAKALDNNQIGEAAKAAGEAGRQLDQLANRLEAAAAQPLGGQPQGAPQENPQGGEQPQAGGEAANPQGGEQAPPGGENAAPKGGEAAGEQGGAQEDAKGGEQAQAGGENAAPKGAEAGGTPQGNAKGGEQAQAGGENAAPKGAEAGGTPQGNAEGGEQAQASGENQGQQPGGENPQGGAQQGNPPAGDQGATAQLAQQASGLAERQQQLAREMQGLAAQNPVAAAAQQQAALGERAGDLAQAAGALQQRAQQMGAGSQAQSEAGTAANELGQAQDQANAAAGQLAEAAGQQGQPSQGQPSEGGAPSPGAPSPGAPSPGAPSPGTPSPGTPSPGAPSPGAPSPGAPSPGAAAPAQQAAAQAMSAAANALEALGQSLGQAAAAAQGQPQGAPATPAPGTPGQMAQAYGSASQAAASQSGMAATQAAGQMSAMAAQANAQAMASGGSLMNQPHPNSRGNPTQGTGVQTTDLSESKLRELGIKLEDWARLPGELRDQILQAASDLGPEEYRPLIKRYFQEVARRGSAPKTPKPEAK